MYKKQSIPTHPLVMLEIPSGSFNCNADRLLSDSLEQGALWLGGNILIVIYNHHLRVLLLQKRTRISSANRLNREPQVWLILPKSTYQWHKIFITSTYIVYRCIGSSWSYPALVTPTVSTLVWVVRFGIDTSVLDDELKSVIHKTTIASLVLLCIAVYKLLLREGDQFSGDNLVDSLHRPNCGESPATSCNLKKIALLGKTPWNLNGSTYIN